MKIPSQTEAISEIKMGSRQIFLAMFVLQDVSIQVMTDLPTGNH